MWRKFVQCLNLMSRNEFDIASGTRGVLCKLDFSPLKLFSSFNWHPDDAIKIESYLTFVNFPFFPYRLFVFISCKINSNGATAFDPPGWVIAKKKPISSPSGGFNGSQSICV